MTPYTYELLSKFGETVSQLLNQIALRRKLKEIYDEIAQIDVNIGTKVFKQDGTIDPEKLSLLHRSLYDLALRYNDVPNVGELVSGYLDSVLSSGSATKYNLALEESKAQTDFVKSKTALAETQRQAMEEEIKALRRRNLLEEETLPYLKSATKSMLKFQDKYYNYLYNMPMSALLPQPKSETFTLKDILDMQNKVLDIYKKSISLGMTPDTLEEDFKKEVTSAIEGLNKTYKEQIDEDEKISPHSFLVLLEQYSDVINNYGSVEAFLESASKDEELVKKYKFFYDFAKRKHNEYKESIYNLLSAYRLKRNDMINKQKEIRSFLLGTDNLGSFSRPSPVTTLPEPNIPRTDTLFIRPKFKVDTVPSEIKPIRPSDTLVKPSIVKPKDTVNVRTPDLTPKVHVNTSTSTQSKIKKVFSDYVNVPDAMIKKDVIEDHYLKTKLLENRKNLRKIIGETSTSSVGKSTKDKK